MKAKRRDKRLDMIHAAEKLIALRRFHEVTLDDVARQARVGKGTIYLHFKDKDDLFFHAATSGLDELCELLGRQVPGKAPFPRQLLNACRSITAFFEGRRKFMRVTEGGGGICLLKFRRRWQAHRKKLRAALAKTIAQGVAEGAIRDDLPPEALAGFLLGILRTRAHDLEDLPAKVRDDRVVIDLFCRGAGADAAPRAGAQS